MERMDEAISVLQAVHIEQYLDSPSRAPYSVYRVHSGLLVLFECNKLLSNLIQWLKLSRLTSPHGKMLLESQVFLIIYNKNKYIYNPFRISTKVSDLKNIPVPNELLSKWMIVSVFLKMDDIHLLSKNLL